MDSKPRELTQLIDCFTRLFVLDLNFTPPLVQLILTQ